MIIISLDVFLARWVRDGERLKRAGIENCLFAVRTSSINTEGEDGRRRRGFVLRVRIFECISPQVISRFWRESHDESVRRKINRHFVGF
jgi:hypothetical protein